jgi:hypothetical protein
VVVIWGGGVAVYELQALTHAHTSICDQAAKRLKEALGMRSGRLLIDVDRQMQILRLDLYEEVRQNRRKPMC